MNELTGVVVGATGLTGHTVVEELLKDNHYKTVRVLGRSTLKIIHPKLEQQTVDFGNTDDLLQKIGSGDVIFCCIGTTLKKVKGDKSLYAKIDHDIPVNVAEAGISHHFKRFFIVSAIGANENSSNFYLRLKGKTENSLKKFPFENLGIFQPSILNGHRSESRFAESIAQTILDLLSFLMLGPLKKYRAVGADNVARAMVYQSKHQKTSVHYCQYQEIMDMARLQIEEAENEQNSKEVYMV